MTRQRFAFLILMGILACKGADDPLAPALTTGETAANPPKSACPGYADPNHCPPFPTGGQYTVTGTVKEWTAEGLKPLSGAKVFGWVKGSGFGYVAGGLESDANGNFSIPMVPALPLQLQVSLNGYSMPCGKLIQVSETNAPVELIAARNDAPFVGGTDLPRVSGTVYKVENGKRVPLAGAWVGVETFMDLMAAWTFTNSEGKFSLCNLPELGWGQWFFVFTDDHIVFEKQLALAPGDDLPLDVEISK